MCRIAAIISKDVHTLQQRIGAMTEAMRHGGPDDQGHYVNDKVGYALGHRRLSIIDTSAAGKQPMHGRGDTLHLSFNGEIYNYLELKQKLTDQGFYFTSHSDTEVVLKGYEAWGMDGLLKQLKGMFSFVLADDHKRKIFAVRDHMGIKPLYVAKRGGDYILSSEVKAFYTIDPGWEPNPDWRVWFLTFGFLPEPITTLQHVSPVKKGHYLVFNFDVFGYSEYTWYQSDWTADESIDTEKALQTTQLLMRQAVQRHLVADVKVGVFLSGGIDSSLISILAAAARPEQPIETLSIEFEDDRYSEKAHQQTVSQLINSKHHSLLVTEQDFVAAWDDIFASLDQPTTDAINNYFICRFAKEKGFKVVLSGLGADELFGGYPSFNRTKTMDRIKQLARLQIFKTGIAGWALSYPNKKIDYFKQRIEASEYLCYRGLFVPKDVAAILHISEAAVWSILNEHRMADGFHQIKGTQNRVSAFESDIYMLDQLLRDSDMQSMWHSIELRVPFLDIDLVNFIHQVPEEIKFPTNTHKYLLTEAFKDLLPASIVNRKKQGFAFPFETWVKQIKAIHHPWLVPATYQRMFEQGKMSYSRLWAIYLINAYGIKKEQLPAADQPKPTALFIYLSAFSKIGGIEKVNRLILQALQNDQAHQMDALAYGLHDDLVDDRYAKPYITKGFSGKILKFLTTVFIESWRYQHLLVGHINLAPAVWLMDLMNPNLQIVLMLHGIEVWEPQKGFKKWLLKRADRCISVSQFTKEKLLQHSSIDPNNISVLTNALDPYFPVPDPQKNLDYLKERYSIFDDKKSLLTITRMSHGEQYKGYDLVLEALSLMDPDKRKNIRYILAGKSDLLERRRIHDLIHRYDLKKNVVMPGYITTDELQDHYQLADLFVMPSKMEGFGIVLIESIASGTPVIAGNADGSAEALQGGRLGTLVYPGNAQQLQQTIEKFLAKQAQNPESRTTDYQQAFELYNPTKYKEQIRHLLIP